jgi:short-subunit dehydrogenase
VLIARSQEKLPQVADELQGKFRISVKVITKDLTLQQLQMKFYGASDSEAIANELKGTGVTVTALCPGPTESGFQKRADMEKSKLVSGKIMDAQTVARIGYRGLMQNQTVVISGLKNQILAQSVRFAPRNLVTTIVRNLQERVDKN